MSDVAPVREGYPAVSPGLAVDGAAAAIAFYEKVFGATERMLVPGPGGKVAHCELVVGDSIVMLSDAAPEMGFRDPKTIGGTPVDLRVYVTDVDATFAAALAEGATALTPVSDQFYGDRTGSFEDPWGHRWTVASHIEDVSPEELDRRMAELWGGA